MNAYRELEKKLLEDIEAEKGFSFKKLAKIFQLNSIYSRA